MSDHQAWEGYSNSTGCCNLLLSRIAYHICLVCATCTQRLHMATVISRASVRVDPHTYTVMCTTVLVLNIYGSQTSCWFSPRVRFVLSKCCVERLVWHNTVMYVVAWYETPSTVITILTLPHGNYCLLILTHAFLPRIKQLRCLLCLAFYYLLFTLFFELVIVPSYKKVSHQHTSRIMLNKCKQ